MPGLNDRHEASSFEWVLQRNCALSPRQMRRFYLSLVMVSSLISIGFAFVGAWFVMPFCGIELLALAVALAVHLRGMQDRDRVVLEGALLTVEQAVGRNVKRTQLRAGWVNVERSTRVRPGVTLCQGGKKVTVGLLVNEAERHRFALELEAALAHRLASA